MEIRVQFPRERARPAGTAGTARPTANRQVDPGEETSDRRQNGGEHQPSSNGDVGGHVNKTV